MFGARLNLAGNPDQLNLWSGDSLVETITPAHWAFTESRFQGCFSLLSDADSSPTEMLEWMTMNERMQKGKTPYIDVADAANPDNTLRYSVDPCIIEIVKERGQNWQTLQEIAGLVTPFTARVEQQVQEKLNAEHQIELTALKLEYEQRISDLEKNMKVEMSGKVRDQLINLMNQRPKRDKSAAENE